METENKDNGWDFFCTKKNKCETPLEKIQAVGDNAKSKKNWSKTVEECRDALASFAEYLQAEKFQTAFFIAVFYNIYFLGIDEVDFCSLGDFFLRTKQNWQNENLKYLNYAEEVCFQ